jgi:hypothetical protein
MPYIGKQPLTCAYQLCDTITTSATATYNLTVGTSPVIPGSAQNCIVSLNGVIQAPVSAYTVSGSTIVFSSTLSATDVIDFILILGNVFDIGKPTDGSVTNASIANGTINLTTKVTGVLPVANGGTNLSSGFANGITEADQWRLSTNIAAAGDADITTNFERNDNNSFDKIGTGMTQSSGIFTFPSTGIYLVQAVYACSGDNASRYVGCQIMTTIDNSSYTTAALNYSHLSIEQSGTSYITLLTSTIVDVTNTTNVKCKFRQQWNATGGANVVRGGTSSNESFFTFIRLGDT